MKNDFQKRFELEKRIDKYMSNNPASYTKLGLAEINELNSFEWSQLTTKITLGEYQVRLMGPAKMTFHILADPAQKSSANLFNWLSIIVLAAAIALSIFVYWWLIFIAFLAPIMSGAAKSAYSEVILGNALVSEKCFSFLFSRGALCLVGNEGVIFHAIN